MMPTRKRAHLTREEAMTVAIIENAVPVPVLAAARRLLERFQAMDPTGDGSGLDDWLAHAPSGPMASFAHGIRDDNAPSRRPCHRHGPTVRPKAGSPSSSS